MRLYLYSLLALAAIGNAPGASPVLARLPNTHVNAARTDAAGNIYLAGYLGTPAQQDTWDAFVAKLSPDGSKVIYSTKFAGSKSDFAAALDIDATGAAYIWGSTFSSDFPVTPGALQTTYQAPASYNGAFAAKVDAQGKVVYSTFIGGSSAVYSSFNGILVDAAGEAYVSGQTVLAGFPATPGAPYTSTDTEAFFVMKLDASGGKMLGAVRGLGGMLASDPQGNIYMAGAWNGGQPSAFPATAGAFQTTAQPNPCGGGGFFLFACSYQYVVKLNGNLTQLFYATLLSGSYGAVPVAVFADAQGNAVVVGTTNSPDYPTTANAYEPVYVANAPPPPAICGPHGCNFNPPPASGYVTRLNASGTGLVYSTFLSGTQSDTISFAAMTPGGIYFSGQAGSPDFPGLDGVAYQCLPETFGTKITLDGSAVGAARIVPGTVVGFDASTATFLAVSGTDLIRFDPAAPPPQISCVLDAADLQPVTQIVPGEILAIFGPRFTTGLAIESLTSLPKTIFGITVAFNGSAAPLLYVSTQQMNVQVPFEIAGSTQVRLDLTLSSGGPVADFEVFPVAAANPTAFLDTATPLRYATANCVFSGYTYSGSLLPLAFNSDGTRNSCTNPAKVGTTVMVFLQGLGVAGQSITGGVNASPGAVIPYPVTITQGSGTGGVSVVSANALAGSLNGVWQVGLQIAPSYTGALTVVLNVQTPSGAVPVRDAPLTIWSK